MMRVLSAMFLVLVAAVACAPTAAPAPAPATQPQATTTPAPAKAAPVAVVDPAMAKLVDAAQKEGSVNLYSYNFVGDTAIAMQRGFQDRYGIKVDIVTGRGAEFTERLRTEARIGNRVGDFTEGSPAHLINIKNLGLSVSLKDLPVLQEKDVWKMSPDFLDKDAHVLAAYPMYMQPFLNTRLVKPGDEPRSWLDLLQPKWKGKILFNDPVVSSSAYLIFHPLIKAGALKEDYLEKLGAQDLLFVTGAPQALERLSRSEAPLYVGTQAALFSNAAREGAPVKVFDLNEGMAGQAIPMVVIKDGPHKNAAKLFANWWLSKEGQSIYARVKGAPTIRKDVTAGLPPPVDLDPAKPIFSTSEDADIQGKMFAEKAWVPLLKKGK
ncbi:MAG: extracellular solute-binding protein [Chloroflexi bacterium]|nr:extracellular solute-binding protein [Chloroflexota bacterium]